MDVIGLICEYNPFHNGHLYHIKKIKELYPNSILILVLNGYFTERGDISLINKENKTKIALNSNIDIVLELPFLFGSQSADIFADVSVKYLNELGCQKIVIGSESNDVELLHNLVDKSFEKEYDVEVKKYLEEGLNYPTALAKALKTNFSFNPNDLLGISYLKSIKKNNFNIELVTIKRTNNYLDISSDDFIISGTNIRNKFLNNIDIKKYIPNYDLSNIENLDLNNYFELLKYKIITEHNLEKYLDVDEGIENRIKKTILNVNNIDELIKAIKTKRYTYNKLKRMLCHILIGVTKEDNKNATIDYLKILGFNKKGKEYLNRQKKKIKLSLKANKDSIVYKYELKAALIYSLYSKKDCLEFEHKNKPLYF